MKSMQYVGAVSAAAVLTATLIAGCGGGGGSTLPGPGPRPSPSLGPSPSPVPSPVLQAMGMQVATGGTYGGGFSYAPAANAGIVFSCGCFPQAGTSTADANGAFNVTSPAQPTPAGSPYVMVASRNYIVVAQAASGSQGWTLMFEGHGPSTTLALGDSGAVMASAAVSDVFTTAAALYVYKKSSQCPPSGCNTAFDDWNFNTVQAWVQHLEAAPNFAELTLLNDIAAQSSANSSLFPSAPLWNPGQATNATINADLNSVTGSEASIPTPCPGGPSGCTGTPTP
ncbi:MAG TPA: hypothetical protein VKT51_08995 [Candidatus Eremiobacteraceae bacterium]|nr:hypothetical protein [Candidatus Eremiobacteraceae bacterium]